MTLRFGRASRSLVVGASTVVSQLLCGIRLRRLGRRIVERLVVTWPDDSAVHLLKGSYLERLGDFEGAILCYERGRSLSPRDPAIYFELGNAHERSGNRRSAIENYQRVLEFSDDIGTAFRDEVLARISILREIEH